jgi:tetratricopeptide (TPR) repeat protein
MLETVREFAIDRLRVADTLDDVRTRHAEHFLELALAAETELSGKDQIDWLNRLEREYDNLTATFDWLLSSGRAEDALRAVSALERFWRAHAHVSEARRWLALGLELATDVPADTRADALWAAARQAAGQSDWDAAAPLLEEALSLFRMRKRHREEVFALSELGYIALRRDDPERAATLCDEALSIARGLGDARATSAVLLTLSDVARMRGEHGRALAFTEEALELRRVLGDPLTIIDSTYHVGVAAFAAGDLDRAAAAFEDTLEHARVLGDALYTAAALCMLGTTGLLKDDLALVAERLNGNLAIYIDLADDRSTAECLCALGGYAAAAGHPEDAARLWGAADAARRSRPLEYAEPVIEERFTPLLVESLGVERLEKLRAEGRRSGFEQTLENLRDVVVSTGAE